LFIGKTPGRQSFCCFVVCLFGNSSRTLTTGRHRDSTPWDFFPRHLSHQEFLIPYKALKKVVHYKSREEWKDILKTILQHALSPNSIYEFDDGIDLLKIWLLLHKLIEASHLVCVRALFG